jgi:radical SAM protein with 4Fe4S-binding SPASM domain
MSRTGCSGKCVFLVVEHHYDAILDADYFAQLELLGGMVKSKINVSNLDELMKDLSVTQKEFFWQSYAWFFAAQALGRLTEGKTEAYFSKGCMLGASEGHVGPDGNISICHKAQHGSAFVIGNVNDGTWNFAKIDELDKWLHDFDDCSYCFAHRFCDFCFEKVKGEPELLDSSRRQYCEFMRRSLRIIFQNMLEVMDRNPRLWREVTHYVKRRIEKEKIEREKQLRAADPFDIQGTDGENVRIRPET